MQVFKVVIRPDPEAPDTRQGWALAPDHATALYLAGPDALAFASTCQWPGPRVDQGPSVFWTN